jgi:hypothetical protein
MAEKTEIAAPIVDRCPWNWRQVEVLCAVGAALTASSENGDKETTDLYRAAAVEYARRAKEMEASGKWVPGRAGDPVVEESIKWRCRQSGEGPEGRSIWERYTEIRREVVNNILPILKNNLSPDGSLPSDRDWESVLLATKNDYWKTRRGVPAAKKDRPLPSDWNPPAWTVFVEYGPPGTDVPQLQEDSVSGLGRKKRKLLLAGSESLEPLEAPLASRAELKGMKGEDPWQNVRTRNGFKADEVRRQKSSPSNFFVRADCAFCEYPTIIKIYGDARDFSMANLIRNQVIFFVTVLRRLLAHAWPDHLGASKRDPPRQPRECHADRV